MFDSDTGGKRWRTFLRGLASVAVAYFFIVTILVATAQQRVAEALEAQNVGYDYNVAIRYYFEPNALGHKALENRKALIEASAKLRDFETAKATLTRSLARQNDYLRSTLAIVIANNCPLTVNLEDPSTFIGAVPASQECVESRGAAAEPGLVRAVASAAREARRADEIQDKLDENASLQAHLADHMKSLEETREALKGQLEAMSKSSQIMAVLDLFQQKCAWKIGCWPGTGILVHVPPTLMAIFVAFSSGMFGALLITLVLYVYPDNRYSFTRSHAFGGRILLGGLIALGVFVLLFSGVAVLGGSDNAAEGSHNVMAYSAIGILCGMFSDQAAAWLSGQAATLLKQQQERQNGRDEEQTTPHPPSPPSPPDPAASV
ncbi:MAG TPA: hypothetical protein VEA61_04730 [Allosphingosinicella sp.]|nr:hypothetical protein [Allosphingosinicella sp.]